MDQEFTLLVVSVLLAISELLAYLPQFEGNSVIQILIEMLRKISGK